MKSRKNHSYVVALSTLLLWSFADTAWAAEDGSDSSSSDQSSASNSDDTAQSEAPKKKKKRRKKKRAASASGRIEAGSADTGGPSHLSIGLLGGYGWSQATHWGLGLRMGLTLDSGLYLGGVGSYHFGSSTSNDDATGNSSHAKNLLGLGAEAGVPIPVLDWLTLRPYFDLGGALVMDEDCSNDDCDTDTTFHVTMSPGVLGTTPIGAGFFAGLDLRYQIVLAAANASGILTLATIGAEF